MGIYKLPKNQWTKDGRKYKYYWNEKDKSGKWKKKFSQAYKTKLDAMNAEREFLNNKVELFPSNLVAKIFGFKKEAFFEAETEAKVAPKVQF